MDSNPIGRPSKYKPEYCEMLLAHMDQGYSIESFAGVVDVCKDTVFEWINVHPDFSDAVKKGKAKSQLRWEEVGREMMMGRVQNCNSAIYIFNMKNRFGWRDQPKEDVESDKNKTLTLNYERRKKISGV